MDHLLKDALLAHNVHLKLNRNKRQMVALKRHQSGCLSLHVHRDLAAYGPAIPLLIDYCKQQGQGDHTQLTQLVQTFGQHGQNTTPSSSARVPWQSPWTPEMNAQLQRWQHLLSDNCQVRTNTNRRTLVSLREQKNGQRVLSIHRALCNHPEIETDLLRFVKRKRRGGHFPILESCMDHVFAQLQSNEQHMRGEYIEDQFAAELLVGNLFATQSLNQFASDIWNRYFKNRGPMPLIDWAPLRRGPRRSIRFGVYKRHPQPRILILPRLAEPWVALHFTEHVIHHEFCHHLQSLEPILGETSHSQRFKQWEQQYPHYESAIRWEHHFRHYFLQDTQPQKS